jgi:hypothetical protein
MYKYLSEKAVGGMLESVPYLTGEYNERLPGIFSRPAPMGVDFAKAAEHLGYDPSLPKKDAARIIFNDLEKRANALLAETPVEEGEERGTHRARFLHTTPKGHYRAVLSFEEIRFTFNENSTTDNKTTAGIEVTLSPI